MPYQRPENAGFCPSVVGRGCIQGSRKGVICAVEAPRRPPNAVPRNNLSWRNQPASCHHTNDVCTYLHTQYYVCRLQHQLKPAKGGINPQPKCQACYILRILVDGLSGALAAIIPMNTYIIHFASPISAQAPHFQTAQISSFPAPLRNGNHCLSLSRCTMTRITPTPLPPCVHGAPSAFLP
jgi:hypothetical protein